MKGIILYAILVLPFIFSCSENPADINNNPTLEQITGTYKTTRFLYESGNITVDLIDEDALIEITLKPDMTTEGRFFIPESTGFTEEGDYDVNLTGTFTMSGNKLNFQHESDTFIRDCEWTYVNNVISTCYTTTREAITVELSKQ